MENKEIKSIKKQTKNKISNSAIDLDILEKENYKCIVTIISRGYSREVIRAAKDKGAKGAVVLSGRGVGQSERKFFGFNIEPENEVVLILATENIVLPIMKGIYAAVDYKSPSRGMVFALPVSYISGMTNAKEFFEDDAK